jgi:amidase
MSPIRESSPRTFDPAFATATATVHAIRTKEISATELLDLTFERIDRFNPAIEAIVWEDRERARRRAREADTAIARGTAGPLTGVPVTIKEAFAYEGSPNSWGLPQLKNAISPRTAIAVERLESAGAIVIGKTNTPMMLGDWQTANPIYGTTNNPWDLTRTPGGSTGGGAAALAAGLGALTLGTDLSGSIRIPAHFCGVYGHKPSLGLVSTDGLQPGPWDGSPGLPMDISVVGPLARSAEDLRIALELLGGPSAEDRRAWNWRLPEARHTRLEEFRVGYVTDHPDAPVSAEVAELCRRTIAELGLAGATLARGWPSGFDIPPQLETFTYLLAALVTVDATDDERRRAAGRLAKQPDDVFAAAMTGPHARWLHETRRRLAVRARWQEYFESHDVFILPASVTAAFPHDHSMPIERRVIQTSNGPRPYIRDLPFWTCFAGLAGLPATIAPIGETDGGLPVGIQIIAPMWEDATAIEFARLLGDVVGGFHEPGEFSDQRCGSRRHI